MKIHKVQRTFFVAFALRNIPNIYVTHRIYFYPFSIPRYSSYGTTAYTTHQQEDARAYVEQYQSAIENIQAQLASGKGTNSRASMRAALRKNQEKLDAWKSLLKEEVTAEESQETATVEEEEQPIEQTQQTEQEQPTESEKNGAENVVEENQKEGIEESGTHIVGENTKEEKQPTEPTPIGTNKWGNVYQWAKGKAREAVDFLKGLQSGYLKGVFHRDDIGDIDLVWGNEKAGLKHIIEKHLKEQNDFDNENEMISSIDNVIKNGTIREEDNSIIIEHGNNRVVVAKDENSGNYVVTAYDYVRGAEEKKNENSATTFTAGQTSEEEEARAVASNNHSQDKDTNNTQNEQAQSAQTGDDVVLTSLLESVEERMRRKSAEEYLASTAESERFLDYLTERNEQEAKTWIVKKWKKVCDFLRGVFKKYTGKELSSKDEMVLDALYRSAQLLGSDTYARFNYYRNLVREMGHDGVEMGNVGEEMFRRGAKNISKQEYELLRQGIMMNNSLYGKNKPIETTFTSDNFYIYNNYGYDSFSVIKSIPIEGNERLIRHLYNILENETYGNTRSIASIIDDVISREKQYSSSDATTQRQRGEDATVSNMDLRHQTERGTDNEESNTDVGDGRGAIMYRRGKPAEYVNLSNLFKPKWTLTSSALAKEQALVGAYMQWMKDLLGAGRLVTNNLQSASVYAQAVKNYSSMKKSSLLRS